MSHNSNIITPMWRFRIIARVHHNSNIITLRWRFPILCRVYHRPAIVATRNSKVPYCGLLGGGWRPNICSRITRASNNRDLLVNSYWGMMERGPLLPHTPTDSEAERRRALFFWPVLFSRNRAAGGASRPENIFKPPNLGPRRATFRIMAAHG